MPVEKGKGKGKSPAVKKQRKSRQKFKPAEKNTIKDVYEYNDGDDSDVDDDNAFQKRFDRDGQADYTYELPDKGNFDDEDIDSDEAFNDEDEDKYGDMFSETNTRPRKSTVIDDEEAEDVDTHDNDDENSDDYVDISSLLQTRADDDAVDSVVGDGTQTNGDDETFDDDNDDDDDDDTHANLLKSMTAMGGGVSSDRRKKRRVEDVTEPRAEGEFNIQGTKDTENVGLDVLLGSLKDSTSFGGLKEKISNMEKKKLTLVKPASKTKTEQATRKVAYDNAKFEVSKWGDVVKANREAEHLSFPLKSQLGTSGVSNSELATKFVPSTELEKQIEGILSSSSSAEQKGKLLTKNEELALASLDPEERKNRVRELRKMRALESHFASKCRRVRKIKSKKFHKVQKKADQRANEKMAAAMKEGGMDGMDPEEQAAMMKKIERDRALNRASLRHRNTSKWAKHMLSRKQLDAGSKEAMAEQRKIDQELRKRVTLNSDSDDDDIDAAAYDSDTMPTTVEQALEEVGNLKQDMEESIPHEGLYKLKFMRDGLAKRKAQAKEELDNLEEELQGEASGDGAGGKSSRGGRGGDTATGRKTFARKGGRVTRAMAATFDTDANWESGDVGANVAHTGANGNSAVTEVDKSINVSVSNPNAFGTKSPFATTASSAPGPVSALSTAEGSVNDASAEGEERTEKGGANPWLTASASQAGLTPEVAMTHFTKKSQKRSIKLQRANRKTVDGHAADDTSGDTVSLDVLEPKEGNPSNSITVSTLNAQNEENDVSREDMDGDVAATANFRLNAAKSTEQRELIERAFAGDNVVEEEFLAEKASLVDKETIKDQDVTIPGWGSWGGTGTEHYRKRKYIKKAPIQQPRKDGQLQHVIINERKDRKVEKKRVAAVPFPFTTSQQYERSIRQPIGKEWNTTAATRALTLPKVTTKTGVVIEPMKLTKSIKKDGKKSAERRGWAARSANKKK